MSIPLPPVPAGLDAHADRIRAVAKRGVEVFRDLGVELSAAKAACPHGQWLHFLAAVGVHERTAQRAMKFAAKVDNSPVVIDDVSSIRDFLGDPAPSLPLESQPGEPVVRRSSTRAVTMRGRGAPRGTPRRRA